MTVTQTATKATKTAKKTATAKASANAAEATKQKPAPFIFGKRPESITGQVTFTSVTGQVVDMECTFVYRTRSEFAKFWDEISEARIEDLIEGSNQQGQLAERVGLLIADGILTYLKAWPLEIELNRENIAMLYDQEPAAPAAFFHAYHDACLHGRRGNSKPQ